MEKTVTIGWLLHEINNQPHTQKKERKKKKYINKPATKIDNNNNKNKNPYKYHIDFDYSYNNIIQKYK